jgi:hypothetical protein
LARYCGFDKYKVWGLTIPQLNYYLKQCRLHVDFTVKVHSMGLASIFGGGAEPSDGTVVTTDENGATYENGYKVADSADMNWLASIL